MMTEAKRLEGTVLEYRGLVGERADRPMSEIRGCLVSAHDWTEGGAEVLVQLARDYGAFMLRNALALAVVLGVEDGELGY